MTYRSHWAVLAVLPFSFPPSCPPLPSSPTWYAGRKCVTFRNKDVSSSGNREANPACATCLFWRLTPGSMSCPGQVLCFIITQNQSPMAESWHSNSGMGGKTFEPPVLPCSRFTCEVEEKGMRGGDEKSFSFFSCTRWGVLQSSSCFWVLHLPGSRHNQGVARTIFERVWTGANYSNVLLST